MGIVAVCDTDVRGCAAEYYETGGVAVANPLIAQNAMSGAPIAFFLTDSVSLFSSIEFPDLPAVHAAEEDGYYR